MQISSTPEALPLRRCLVTSETSLPVMTEHLHPWTLLPITVGFQTAVDKIK